MRISGAGVAILALAACGSSAPPGVFLPTYRAMDGMPAAEIRGQLVERNGCLTIEADGERWLLLWPPGSSATLGADGLVVRSGGAQAVVGTAVVTGGGEYGPESRAFVADLIGTPPPAACADIDRFWLARPVEPAID
jgi:hypothetical protein